MSTNKASITAVFGASGSGKSTYAKRRIKAEKPGRLLIWDPQGEYADSGTVTHSLADVLNQIGAAGKRGRFAFVYQPKGSTAAWKEQFNVFCKIAYAAGGVFMVAEELADVTQPAWAPEGWGIVTRKGRHTGMKVIGLSQRPASIDKHFFGNATAVRTGRLNFESDVKTIANVTGQSADSIRGLMPLEWIEKDMQTGKISNGTIKF